MKNDRRAQYDLYRLLAPRLNGVAYRYLKNSDDINDALQDTFLSIFKNIQMFKGESKFETWATRILINHILQKIQKENKIVVEDIENVELMHSVATDGNLLYEELIKLLEMLPEGKRLVFNLYVIEGFSHKEIAEMLHITESTSKTQLFRAKEMLLEMHKKFNHVRPSA